MTSQQIARVDGLVTLLDCKGRVANPELADVTQRRVDAEAACADRAPDDRRARVPAAGVGAAPIEEVLAESERLEIRAELATAGIV